MPTDVELREKEVEYAHICKEFLYQLKKLLDDHYRGDVGRHILFVDESTKNIYRISVIYEDTSDPDFKRNLFDIGIVHYILRERNPTNIKINFIIEIIPAKLSSGIHKSFGNIDLLKEDIFNRVLNESFLFLIDNIDKIMEKFEGDRDIEFMP